MLMLILPQLTREFLLTLVSQEEIFARYFSISLSIIDECLNKSKLIISPIRNDKNPTFGFYKDASGRIRGNDFAGYFHGDCFDAVGYQYHLDPTDKKDFAIIKDIIAKEFQVWYYSPDYLSDDVLKKSAEFRDKHIISYAEKSYTTIELTQLRSWAYVDTQYWTKKYYLKEPHLTYFNVYLPQVVKLNGRVIYTFTPNDPCYAYFLGNTNQTIQGITLSVPVYKLYFPKRKSFRFITNDRKLQGLNQIKKAKYGVITKSLKDVMCLKLFGINAVAVSAESTMPSKEEMAIISKYYENIYTLMDFDHVGIKISQDLKRQYKTKPLFFTNGSYNTLNFGAKDFSDFLDINGFNFTKDFIEFFIDNNFEINSEFFDYFNYHF
jgi:5S rRNA maturation endonuclease (ribonuclease M5)